MRAHSDIDYTCQPVEPLAFTPTVEAMAEAMRTHHQHCTEDLLQSLGFPLGFQRQHKDEAVALANRRFVAVAERTPQPSLAEREAQAASVIHEHMPPTIVIVAELQARGFSASEIDKVLPRARARAALSYARGGVH